MLISGYAPRRYKFERFNTLFNRAMVTNGKSMNKLDCKNALASRANTIAEKKEGGNEINFNGTIARLL